MPDVGVLQLSIQDNSSQAAEGLNKLVSVLESIKGAVNIGSKMGTVARNIEKLAKVVDENLAGSTISKLNELCHAFENLQGIGAINIKINYGNNGTIEQTAEVIQAATENSHELAQTFSGEFANAPESIVKVTHGLDDVKEAAENVKQSVTGLDFSKFNIDDLPLGALGMKIGDSTKEMYKWGQIANDSHEIIEEVKESVVSIIPYQENLENSWEKICEREREAARIAEEEYQRACGAAIAYSMNANKGLAEKYKEQKLTLEEMFNRNNFTGGILRGELRGKNERTEEYAFREIAKQLGTTAEEVREKVYTMRQEAIAAKEPIEQLGDAMKDASSQGDGMSKVTEYMDMSKIDLMTMKMNGMKDALAQDIEANKLSNEQIAERTIQIQNVASKIEELKQAEESAKTSTHGLNSAFENLKSGISNLGITKLIGQFARIAKYRMIRSVIKHITSGFSEGVQNVYQYSKAIGSDFAPSMDAAASSIQQMKNSIGAMAAPVIQSLIPVLQTVVNWFISLVNYANQFFALINGQNTWTRALPQTTTAFDDQKKAAKGASSAMKDLLADWDELNIIQSSNSGSGSGATGAASDYANMFEEVSEFNNALKNIVDGIKDNFGDIWSFVKRIATVILGWKLSNAFEGWLGTIGGLVGAAFTLDIVFNLVNMFADNFLKTGDTGYLIGDLLTTLIGGVLTKKILSKVLGGKFATLAIPLTLLVSAFANTKAVISSTDVTALSAESITTSIVSALEVGGAWAYLSYVSGGTGIGLSAGLGGSVALMTLGALIGIKAIKDTIDTKELSADTIKADLLAAGMVGAGVFLAGVILKAGTIGTLMAVGGGAAILTLAALIGLEAIIASEQTHVSWGNYEATQEQIKAFVEDPQNGVFTASPDTVLSIVDPVIEVVNSENKELSAQVEEVKLTVKKLSFYYDTNNTLKELEEQIFGNSEKGKKGLIDQFKDTAKAHQTMIETGITLVPTTGSNEDGSPKEILERSSEAWKMLTGHMDDLGSELWDHLQIAYSDSVDSGTKAMELRTIASLTQMMTNVSTAITKGESYEKAVLELEENLGNMTKGSWNSLFKYINEYKEQIANAFETAYDQTTISIAGQVSGLKASWDNELELAANASTEDERKKHLDQAKVYEDEYNYWSKYLEQRRAGRNKAIEDAANDTMNSETVERIRKVLTSIIDKDAIEASDVSGLDLSEDMWTALFNTEGIKSDYAERELTGWLDSLIDAAFDQDAEPIKEAIKSGLLNYGDVIDKSVIEELADTIGINEQGTGVKSAWEMLIEKYFGDNNNNPKTPGLDNTELDSTVKDAKDSISGLVSYVTDEMSKLSGTGFDVYAIFHGNVDTVPVHPRASGGFVKSGDLVMANENGNFEMLGRMGNQPVVANNQQIVSGISQGVSQANSGVESRLGAIETMLTRILQKEFVARAVPSSGWGQHGVQSTEAWNKVTG